MILTWGVEGFDEVLSGSNNGLSDPDSSWKTPDVRWSISKLGEVQVP